MNVLGGAIFALVGGLVAIFFETFRDFCRRIVGPQAGGRLPDRPGFIVAIRLFGSLFFAIGFLMCWLSFK
jgi:hypothetical protein